MSIGTASNIRIASARSLALVAAALVVSLVAPAAAEPGFLATQEEAQSLAGKQGPTCFSLTPDRQVCRWRIDGLLVQSGDRADSSGVNLVCRLPKNPDEGLGSCMAHSRAMLPESTLPAVSAPGPEIVSSLRDGLIQRRLAMAGDLNELSHLVGDVPDSCSSEGSTQTCRWTLPVGSLAHARLSSQADAQRPVTLRCELPIAGYERNADSCQVEPAR